MKMTKDKIEEYREIAARMKEMRAEMKAAGIKIPKVSLREKKEKSEEHKYLMKAFEDFLTENRSTIDSVFEQSKTDLKPTGQKWITFKGDGRFGFAIVDQEYIKPEKPEKPE